MAQKSLPALNKVNTSMIWYSTFYNNNYKWLSSQSLYFLYFFNKLTVYLDLFYLNLFWVQFEKTSLSYGFKKTTKLHKNETRFFKPVTSYLVNLGYINLVFNLYYKTSLGRFQSIFSEKKSSPYVYGLETQNIKTINKMFYITN